MEFDQIEKWRGRGRILAGGRILAAGVALFTIGVLVAAWSGGLLTAAGENTDNPPDDTVGTIEGEAIALQGPMSVDVVHGQVKTILRSGNDIRVKSGHANLELVEGGKIAICGPAHLSVLKSGELLTLALDTGVLRVYVDKQPTVTVYTAQIQAKPISIGEGAQDALIGFDAPGVMCVRARSGAIRLEQQLTGQNVIVPQGGDILLNNGALEGLQNTTGHCACEFEMAKAVTPPPEISRIATAEEIRQRQAEAKAEAKTESKTETKLEAKRETPPPVSGTEKLRVAAEKLSGTEKAPAAKQDPVYQVFMPPLAYDARAAAQPENFDPKLILLVRRVRVRPTLIFQGRVEGDPVAHPVAVAQPTGPKPVAPAPAVLPKNDSVVNRVRAFLRNLFS